MARRDTTRGARSGGRLRRTLPRVLIGLLGLAVAAACGAPPGRPGGGSGEAEGATATEFTLRVVEPAAGEAAWAPLPGAVVALDLPSGDRQEAISDALGFVTFPGVDWSSGDHTLTTYKEGYVLTSRTGLNTTTVAWSPHLEGVPVIWLAPLVGAGEAIRVTGSAVGLVDSHHSYLVNVLRADVGTDWLGSGGQPFSVWVSPDTPFVLQGLELDFELLPTGQGQRATIYRVAQQPVEPSAVDLQGLELDFDAWAMSTYTAEFVWPLPVRAETPLRRGTALGVVAPPGSRYTIGWGQYIHISEDANRFDVSMLWVEPHWVQDAVTQLRIRTPEGTALAVVEVPGYPRSGMSIPVPLDVPELHRIAVAHPIEEPIRFTWYDDHVPATGVDVVRNGVLVWRIEMGPRPAALTFPTPPTGVDLEAQLSATPRFYVWGADLSQNKPYRWARSLDLGLEL